MDFIENLTSVWDFFQNTEKPIVLYGMGNGADKVMAVFDKLNIKPCAVTASDAFVRGQKYCGFTVKKLSDLEAELGDFVIALCFASQLEQVIKHIKAVADRHKLLVPCVPVFGDNIFDRSFYCSNSAQINLAYSLLEDSQSRLTYESIIKFRYTGDIKYLSLCETDKDEAFYNILKLTDDEAYLDLGAYKGDTIEEFLRFTGGRYKSVTALEPNLKNFSKLKDYCKNMENVSLWQLGSYIKNTVINFNNKPGRSSAACRNGVPTRVCAVDSILCGKRITYAKLDVEGAESETLTGMEKTLRLFKPKLNVAAYHRSEDIFALILQLKSINPEYKFYLRHHPYIPCWDTNLYCI